ncbi:hypothetical protein SCB49_05330 [unidentified eubacterium SCB49]|nr:hypothetical protein SCB49_05330 [unidentified eubacterium SCB49]
MNPKKVLLYIGLILLFLGLAFCGLLYYTLRTKVNDITDQKPFTSFVNEKMVLGNDAILVNNYEHFVHEEPLYLDAVGSQLFEGTSIAHQLTKGDTVIIHSVKDFTNGVSGTTSTVLFGNVTTGNPPAKIPFEYTWEAQQIEKNTDGVFVFSFELAEWEKE